MKETQSTKTVFNWLKNDSFDETLVVLENKKHNFRLRQDGDMDGKKGRPHDMKQWSIFFF